MPRANPLLRIESDRVTPRARITVPLTPTELRAIARAAKRCRMPCSRFIRLAALSAADCPPAGPSSPAAA